MKRNQLREDLNDEKLEIFDNLEFDADFQNARIPYNKKFYNNWNEGLSCYLNG